MKSNLLCNLSFPSDSPREFLATHLNIYLYFFYYNKILRICEKNYSKKKISSPLFSTRNYTCRWRSHDVEPGQYQEALWSHDQIQTEIPYASHLVKYYYFRPRRVTHKECDFNDDFRFFIQSHFQQILYIITGSVA